MRTDYDVIVLGCSCYALGLAAKDAQRTLILESGEGFGGEFVDALRPCTPIVRPEGEAAALYDELTARGIMDEASAAQGRIHLPAVNVVLNRIALEKGLNLLMRTRVACTEKTEDGVKLTAVCCARTIEFTCRTLIDTRSTDYARLRALDPDAAFFLAANAFVPDGLTGEKNGLRVEQGFLPGEAWLEMKLNGLPSANDRETLMRAFEARGVEWLPMKLLSVAHAWGVMCRSICEKTEQGWYIPGCGFGNPVEAFAAGMEEVRV